MLRRSALRSTSYRGYTSSAHRPETSHRPTPTVTAAMQKAMLQILHPKKVEVQRFPEAVSSRPGSKIKIPDTDNISTWDFGNFSPAIVKLSTGTISELLPTPGKVKMNGAEKILVEYPLDRQRLLVAGDTAYQQESDNQVREVSQLATKHFNLEQALTPQPSPEEDMVKTIDARVACGGVLDALCVLREQLRNRSSDFLPLFHPLWSLADDGGDCGVIRPLPYAAFGQRYLFDYCFPMVVTEHQHYVVAVVGDSLISKEKEQRTKSQVLGEVFGLCLFMSSVAAKIKPNKSPIHAPKNGWSRPVFVIEFTETCHVRFYGMNASLAQVTDVCVRSVVPSKPLILHRSRKYDFFNGSDRKKVLQIIAEMREVGQYPMRYGKKFSKKNVDQR